MLLLAIPSLPAYLEPVFPPVKLGPQEAAAHAAHSETLIRTLLISCSRNLFIAFTCFFINSLCSVVDCLLSSLVKMTP